MKTEMIISGFISEEASAAETHYAGTKTRIEMERQP
jgi:hypothetical protein